jgi:DNA-binding NarL/FixJ family response regulator
VTNIDISGIDDAELRYTTGDWDAALADVASLREFLPPYGTPPTPWLPWQAYGLAALISAHRGQDATADALLAQLPWDAAHSVPSDGAVRSKAGFALAARATRAEQSGRTDVALDLLAAAHAADLGQKQAWLPQLARLALEAGRRDLLESAAQSAEAAVSGSAARTALARHIRGLAQGDAELLAAAARYHRSADRRFDFGRVEEELAALAASSGDPVNARRHLAWAAEAYVALGARAEILRVDARLLRAGVSRARRGMTPARPERGRDTLSPIETKVAELVAAGMSNPEIGRALILSPRTVQTHVSHILLKLGVGTRSGIVRAVAGRGER